MILRHLEPPATANDFCHMSRDIVWLAEQGAGWDFPRAERLRLQTSPHGILFGNCKYNMTMRACTAGIDKCLVAKHLQSIENIIGCSETKFDQWFCTKHDKIIAHVFTMILHRTWKHNRPDVLWIDRHTNICLCTKQLQNMENIPCSSSKQAIYFAVWYNNIIQKQYIGFCEGLY